MKKNKLLFGVLGLILLISLAYFVMKPKTPSKVHYELELLQNGGFDQLNAEGLPLKWDTDAYIKLEGVTRYESIEGQDGHGVKISNFEANDARFMQSVAVEPNTLYCLKGLIKAKAEEGLGANLSVQDVYIFSESVYDTSGQWKEVSLYGKTGANQHSLTLYARLGGYSGEAVGEASFDQLSFKAVQSAPRGVEIKSFEKRDSAPALDETEEDSLKPNTTWAVLIALASALGLMFIAKKAEATELKSPDASHPKLLFAFLLFFAFLTRLLAALVFKGYPVDVGCFTSWATQMAKLGPSNFYQSGIFCDYPPGYMLILWPIGLLGRLVGGTAEWMIKLPSMLCDLWLIYVLYSQARIRASAKTALLLCALYAFNPLPYLAGSIWGQADSVPAVLLLITVIYASNRQWKKALPVYVLSVLIKPQALMVGPLGLAAVLLNCYVDRKNKPWKELLWGVLYSLLTALLILLPFMFERWKNGDPGLAWLISLYSGTMSYYNYATVNATNLYFLFQSNWASGTGSSSLWLRLTGVFCLNLPLIISAIPYFKQKNALVSPNPGPIKLLPYALYGLLMLSALIPMSYSLFGTLMMIGVFCLVIWGYIRHLSLSNLALSGAVILIGFSVFGTMMHERYLFLSIPLLVLSYIQKRDKRILILLISVSLLCFLNTFVVLDRGLRIGGPEGNLDAPISGLKSDSAWLEYLLSLASLPIAVMALYIGFILPDGERVQKLSPLSRTKPDKQIGEAPKAFGVEPIDRKDLLLIIGVSLLYAILSLFNLGSMKSPQNPWVSTETKTQAVLDLGQNREFSLLYLGNIHWRVSNSTIDISSDYQHWTSTQALMKEGDCFIWRTQCETLTKDNEEINYTATPLVHHGRYIRINASSIGLSLMEIKAFDPKTGDYFPLQAMSEDAKALVDEQDTLTTPPSWFNSMYFDEIYHARTAYEQYNALNNQDPSRIYETTHPPFGKLLMTLSISIFGMTPFAWRLPGALAGVLMLPGLYLMGKLITKRRDTALLAMLALAFDCIHFTQTRIATIDSFVTLFIIYAYYFMMRFAFMDFRQLPFRRLILNLGLSGLMMGFSIASKWTGAYAAVGLAMIFFWALGRQSAVFLKHSTIAPIKIDYQYLLKLGLWCVLFFIVLPVLIYYFSFYPVFVRTPGGLSIEKVLQANQNMLSYHSTKGLGMDHYFYSPWYQWPLSLKPIWYYSDKQIDGTASTIMALGNLTVWWGGLIALVGVLFGWIQQRMASFVQMKKSLFDIDDMRPGILLIAFLCQYLPWVLVPRGTYIYHYFPSVPFIILASALLFERFLKIKPKPAQIAMILYLLLALGFFIAFFPYASGVRVSTQWLDSLKWFPNWLFY